MRILAFSDIHNNLTCVDKLIDQVCADQFDCAVVAGDIGNATAPAFFEKLSSLPLPVYYVYGNWDSKLAFDEVFSSNSLHLHQKLYQVGDYFLTGFSGCPAHWGHNPVYLEKKAALESAYNAVIEEHQSVKRSLSALKRKANQHAADEAVRNNYHKARAALQRVENSQDYKQFRKASKSLSRDVLEENKKALFKRIAHHQLDIKKVIIVTHERLSRLEAFSVEPPLLNMFGHIHTYSHQTWRGTTFINVSHLDSDPVSFGKKKAPSSPGNFCTVTVDGASVVSEKINLKHN